MGEFLARGKTLLFVSHSAASVQQICSRVCVLSHGRKVFDGPTAEGLEHYHALAEGGS
jgi:ABC-2 type transport system ATP-binding protein